MIFDYITIKEASNILGYDVAHIARLLRERKLEGRKWGREWMVKAESVMEMHQRGRLRD